MLSSIHPLGERAKHNRFAVTAVFHLAGAALGGFLLGTCLAGPSAAAGRWLAEPVAVLAAAVLCIAGSALAAGIVRFRVPSWRRQVDERWLTDYRGWVYGFGYGVQLGFAVATIITTPLVYAALGLAVLSGSVSSSILVATTFGVVRGATLLVGSRVTTPERLVRFHQRFEHHAGRFNHVASSAVATAGIVLSTDLWLR